jgi:hypothetical protein
MATVIPIVAKDAVEDAWEAYAALASQLIGQPHLIADRAYNEAMARAHDRWRKLYLAWIDASLDNVVPFPVPA